MSTGAPAGARFTPVERNVLIGGVVAGSLIPLNSTMIAVALHDIGRDLGVRASSTAVLVTAYLVAMLVAQPIGGRIGDRLGSRTVARVGLVAFTVASVAAGVAPNFPTLLVARCAQALAGAAVMPNVQALMRGTIRLGHRGRAFGLLGSGIGAGAAAGPVIGGLLVDVVGWRAIFLVNLPVTFAALWLVSRVQHVAAAEDEDDDGQDRGAVLRNRRFLAACATQATSNFALYAVLLSLPLVLEARRWSTSAIGVTVSVLTLGMLVLAPVGGRMGDRHGRARPVVWGTAVMTMGCALLAGGVTSAVLLVLGPLVMGIGSGISGASLQTAALEQVPQSLAGSAAGVFSTSRYVGSIASSTAVAVAGIDGASSAPPVLAATAVVGAMAVGLATRLKT